MPDKIDQLAEQLRLFQQMQEGLAKGMNGVEESLKRAAEAQLSPQVQFFLQMQKEMNLGMTNGIEKLPLLPLLLMAQNYPPPITPPRVIESSHCCPLPWVCDQLKQIQRDFYDDDKHRNIPEKIKRILDEINGGK